MRLRFRCNDLGSSCNHHGPDDPDQLQSMWAGWCDDYGPERRCLRSATITEQLGPAEDFDRTLRSALATNPFVRETLEAWGLRVQQPDPEGWATLKKKHKVYGEVDASAIDIPESLLSGFGVVIRGRASSPTVTKIFPYKS